MSNSRKRQKKKNGCVLVAINQTCLAVGVLDWTQAVGLPPPERQDHTVESFQKSPVTHTRSRTRLCAHVRLQPSSPTVIGARLIIQSLIILFTQLRNGWCFEGSGTVFQVSWKIEPCSENSNWLMTAPCGEEKCHRHLSLFSPACFCLPKLEAKSRREIIRCVALTWGSGFVLFPHCPDLAYFKHFFVHIFLYLFAKL